MKIAIGSGSFGKYDDQARRMLLEEGFELVVVQHHHAGDAMARRRRRARAGTGRRLKEVGQLIALGSWKGIWVYRQFGEKFPLETVLGAEPVVVEAVEVV